MSTTSSSTPILRKAALFIAGGGVYASALVLANHYLRTTIGNGSSSSDIPPPPNDDTSPSSSTTTTSSSSSSCCCSPSSTWVNSPYRAKRFDDLADAYDRRISWDETVLGMPLLRRYLLRHAYGDVVEVGAGTARNLPYYRDSKVQRLVLVDRSDQMLRCALEKVRETSSSSSTSSWFSWLSSASSPEPRPTVAVVADASHLPLPDHSFDTVVDTFGLCSYDDPVAALQEMCRVCKPTGQVLLLEHGRSHTWDFISRHLDENAEKHAHNWGCVWNRDLDQVLTKSGLQIVSLSKWHFGTTYCVVCVPPPPTTTHTPSLTLPPRQYSSK